MLDLPTAKYKLHVELGRHQSLDGYYSSSLNSHGIDELDSMRVSRLHWEHVIILGSINVQFIYFKTYVLSIS